MRVQCSTDARQDLRDIGDFIAADNPVRASFWSRKALSWVSESVHFDFLSLMGFTPKVIGGARTAAISSSTERNGLLPALPVSCRRAST